MRSPFFNGRLRYLVAESVRLQPQHPVPEIPEKDPQNNQFGELMLKSGELPYKKHVIVEDELDGYATPACADSAKQPASIDCGSSKPVFKEPNRCSLPMPQ